MIVTDMDVFVLISDTSVDLPYGDRKIHVSLIPNPSHLEVISTFQLLNLYTVNS